MIELFGLTAIQSFYIASIAGAILCCLAGATFVALRRPRQTEELARLRSALLDAEALSREHARISSNLRRELEDDRKLLVATQTRVRETASELEQSQSLLRGMEREVAVAQTRVKELETELAAKHAATRELATEHDRLSRRLADAEALRTEYVRLRTAVTDAEFLKAEVARLERELRDVKVAALTGTTAIAPRRQPRGSTGMTKAPKSISESLTWAIERFADTGTRGSVVADTLGFPLASSGDDGLSLAAYGALVMETANRATQFLPLAKPAAIEIVDERGARVSVWRFDVGSDPLLLVNLAISPVDTRRVETTLADLTTILAPSLPIAARL